MEEKRPLKIEFLIECLLEEDSPNYIHELVWRTFIALQYVCYARVGEVAIKVPEYKEKLSEKYSLEELEKRDRIKRLGLKLEKEGYRKLKGYGEPLHGLRWGDFNIDEIGNGFVEIRIRTEKNPNKPYRTIYVPARWKKKPERWSSEKWEKMVRLEKGILGLVDEYHEEQARFNHVRVKDELFSFREKSAQNGIKRRLGYSSHFLRHSRISHGDGRFSPKQLQNQAGHSSLDMTSRYLHFDKEDFVSRF